MAILLVDVWLGVLDRYVLHLQLAWVEELARYIMIWGIMLAVPCCTAAREHMGLRLVVDRLPLFPQQLLSIAIGVTSVGFFTLIAVTGIAFAEKGFQQFSTVFALPMFWAYLAIPVTFGLTAFQGLLVLALDVIALFESRHSDVKGAVS
ncbi:C4-dicarboxylate ABC transporter permease [Veronia nyctiphanis]|uniref:TRAP transporter small permease protein n=1 Tax=Veronia nyctiphanis TaxID=1278244 RepID=A0A4Q0YM48_9GAMM|nr:TRAP transporter small permease subunit [Veronia nyctiphanis]RXJ71786.1 C4-dicarboxylate ABC transporter permease [Veronia nyctiphanis]